jgi:signal transduction histidine kinase
LFELQRQLTRLERLAAAGQLAAQFAHEVGTPLNLISGHVQLLRARATDERVIKRLDVIGEQIVRITNIVRSMLDSTRRPAPKPVHTDVNRVLTQTLDAASAVIAAHNVELHLALDEKLGPISGDPDGLQQTFINLINNSLDAMPAGGALYVTTSETDGSISIEIGDTGHGIPGDEIEHVFEPLFTSKPDGGTGLGLTIAKQIINQHGGAVTVDSEPYKRTTFRITLPRKGLHFAGEESGQVGQVSDGSKETVIHKWFRIAGDRCRSSARRRL